MITPRRTKATIDSRPRDLCVPTCTSRRRNLVSLVRWVRQRTDSEHPRVVARVTPEGHGLGLYATRDIPKGETVVFYGGPCLSIEPTVNEGSTFVSEPESQPESQSESQSYTESGPSRTHSMRVSERHRPIEQATAVVIDGICISQTIGIDDPVDPLLSIAGALMNSSRGVGEPNVRRTHADAMFCRIGTGRYAAMRFAAARDIEAGEELRWDYAFRAE